MRALITGVLGQDGSYLAEQLLADGHEVCGLVRRSNVDSPAQLHWGDLLDQDSLERALGNFEPDVVFNLAAVTSPGGGWGAVQPPLLVDVTGVGVVHLLDAMVNCAPEARLVHASSSAIYDPHRYGLYGAAKRLAHDAVTGYRGQLHCSNAVLFSHTSPRQDARFLARKICTGVARIAVGLQDHLVLGDVDSARSWGYAPDYMNALCRIAEQDTPRDWVICEDLTRSVRELAEAALKVAGLDWSVVRIDPDAPRVPNEIPAPQEERLNTRRALGWAPGTSFEAMVEELVDAA